MGKRSSFERIPPRFLSDASESGRAVDSIPHGHGNQILCRAMLW